jgi:hypothetical protein
MCKNKLQENWKVEVKLHETIPEKNLFRWLEATF